LERHAPESRVDASCLISICQGGRDGAAKIRRP
jgi:hypothetical protein